MNLRRHFRATAGPCASTTLILRFVTLITIVACFSIALSAQGGPATTGQWYELRTDTRDGAAQRQSAFLGPSGCILDPQIWDPATGTVTPTPLPGYQVFLRGALFSWGRQNIGKWRQSWRLRRCAQRQPLRSHS